MNGGIDTSEDVETKLQIVVSQDSTKLAGKMQVSSKATVTIMLSFLKIQQSLIMVLVEIQRLFSTAIT